MDANTVSYLVDKLQNLPSKEERLRLLQESNLSHEQWRYIFYEFGPDVSRAELLVIEEKFYETKGRAKGLAWLGRVFVLSVLGILFSGVLYWQISEYITHSLYQQRNQVIESDIPLSY